MKKSVTIILLIVIAFSFVACNDSGDSVNEIFYDAYAPIDDGEFAPSSSVGGVSGIVYKNKAILSDGEILPSGEYDDSYGEYIEERGEQKEITAGQITAKAWNDNDGYALWRGLFVEGSDNQAEGKFYSYSDGAWAYDTARRVKITVTKGETPVCGATIKYFDSNQNKSVVRTDAKGVAYLFPKEEEGSFTVTSGEASERVSFTKENRDLTVDLTAAQEKSNLIKLMFVIDATGSMGDEMDYVAAELTDVVHRVAAQATGVKIELALLFYRDNGDNEKFAYHDFVTVSEEQGLASQVKIILDQSATGGGDTPEAVDEALLMGASKDWGTENATNLMVLVLDAPPHGDESNRDTTFAALSKAAEKGIRICPVLCSGADNFCEYVTRLAALVTGGTSVFVTDDSGIGGAHLDPELPDATVEKLNDLLVRLIVGYHTGDFGTPVAWDQGAGRQGQEQD